MSRLTRLLNQCHEKQRYPSRKRADTARMRSERAYGHPMHSYYCEMCKGWHNASGKALQQDRSTQRGNTR